MLLSVCKNLYVAFSSASYKTPLLLLGFRCFYFCFAFCFLVLFFCFFKFLFLLMIAMYDDARRSRHLFILLLFFIFAFTKIFIYSIYYYYGTCLFYFLFFVFFWELALAQKTTKSPQSPRLCVGVCGWVVFARDIL